MHDRTGPLKVSAVLGLIILVLLLYWPVQNYDYVNFDDEVYASHNFRLGYGFTIEGLVWAFTNQEMGHWHPLTWLSHMADVQLFGRNPAGHHWTNVLIHIFNTLLLLAILHRMTNLFWRSLAVAALFALHPLNVESVAWISNRKNVLSAFFWLLTLWAYHSYVLSPGLGRYAILAGTFLLGLLAKAMLVTLPFVLLLLDFWPLRRWRPDLTESYENKKDYLKKGLPSYSFFQLVYEKIPLFLMTIGSIILAVRAAKFAGALVPIDAIPFSHRLMNALVAYAAYIGKMIHPIDLAVLYPYPQSWSAWALAGAAFLLIAVSVLVVCLVRRAPYMIVGWLWYLGTLVPVIGLAQAGEQAMADRYAYIPLIGLFLVLVWVISDGAARRGIPKWTLPVFTIAVLAILSAVTLRQLPYWQNSITLFEHALTVTRNNSVAHNNLGQALFEAGRPAEAIVHYRAALKIREDPDYRNNLGVALEKTGRDEEALEQYRLALKGHPLYSKAYNNIGVLLGRRHRIEEAQPYFRKALELNPEYADACNNLGFTLALQGKPGEAIILYEKALSLDPETQGTNRNWGMALTALERYDEAVEQFRKALRLQPDDAELLQLLRQAVKKAGGLSATGVGEEEGHGRTGRSGR